MNRFEEGLLTYLDAEQLKIIQGIKIGIGGAGGLGSTVAVLLTRTGFKNIEIVDKDTIEPSNLNRQQYFLSDIGSVKVAALKNLLLKINPDIHILDRHTSWSDETGEQFFRGCDFIVEAFDQVDWKYKFVEYYRSKTRTLISGNGMAGLSSTHPILVKKMGNVYFVGDGQTETDEQHPPLAPRVTLCAAHIAQIILNLTLSPALG
ncbi:MAG: sulfur carrier protein ThiS adenylyltransferase ThiF [Candidatus Omnitrophota bacterium]